MTTINRTYINIKIKTYYHNNKIKILSIFINKSTTIINKTLHNRYNNHQKTLASIKTFK